MASYFSRHSSRWSLFTVTVLILVVLLRSLSLANPPPPPAFLVLSFGGSNNSLLVATYDGVRLRQVQGATLGRTLKWHKAQLDSIIFADDGKTAAAVILQEKDRVRLLDLRSGKVLRTLRSLDFALQVSAFSPNSRIVACHAWGNEGDERVLWWDTRTGKVLRKIRAVTGDERLRGEMAFSPDSKTFVTANYVAPGEKIGKVRLWDVPTGRLRRTIKVYRASHLEYLAPAMMSVAFSPDGKVFACGFHDYVVRLWDTKSGRLLRTLKCSNSVSALAFSPDGMTLATNELSHKINLWNLTTGQLQRTLTGNPQTSITSLTYSPNGRVLASGNFDGSISLWNLR